MDTRETGERQTGGEGRVGGHEKRGLRAWIRRNPWLLLRLSMVVIFSFSAYMAALNLSYGLEADPVVLTAEQVNRGELPANLERGDYVEIRGTPDLGPDVARGRFGTPESRVGVASRYGSANYFYFRLEETGDNLLIQKASTPPDFEDPPNVFGGRLATVGTVIFHDTTQAGLKQANLPHKDSIPVIESSDTPSYYRQLFPVYLLIVALFPVSLAYLAWRKNKPLLD